MGFPTLRGLAIVVGLVEWEPSDVAGLPWEEAQGRTADWYPPTPWDTAAEVTSVDGIPRINIARAIELHHEEYPPPPPTWSQAAVLGQWRRRMNHWLDVEWLTWRELLSAYPDPAAS